MSTDSGLVILGVETSCDETAAAVVVEGRWIRSNVIASQVEIHARYGGVVPEIASRQHLLAIVPTISRALDEAGVTWQDLNLIAVTRGPGLAGSLLVGLNAAKAVAYAYGLPIVGVNHLEGHLYSNWLGGADWEFPLVCLIVSGAHSDIMVMLDHGRYQRLGRTRDDAAGEAFDKVARILDLGYPGGPAIQRAASQGDPARLSLPRAWMGDSYDFSFSGLKTAVLRVAEKREENGLSVADIAASFQESVVDVLVKKTLRAAVEVGASAVLLAGGVAANQMLREQMAERCSLPVACPPIQLCTDNAAMIAAVGYRRYRLGERATLSLDVEPGLRLR